MIIIFKMRYNFPSFKFFILLDKQLKYRNVGNPKAP